MDCGQILPNLFVGSFPGTIDVVDQLIRELRITAVLNLQTDKDMPDDQLDRNLIDEHYRACSISHHRIPIEDCDTDDLCEKLPACVRILDSLLRAGHSVYVHCTLGWYRSPSVALAYLHWSCGWPFERALSYLIEHRDCAPDLDAVRRAHWQFPGLRKIAILNS